MARVLLLLLGLEIGGCGLLVSVFGLTPVMAFGVMACVLAALVALSVLFASRSRSD